MARRKYTTSEKQYAVSLAQRMGVAAAARHLGIPESTLRGWIIETPRRPLKGQQKHGTPKNAGDDDSLRIFWTFGNVVLIMLAIAMLIVSAIAGLVCIFILVGFNVYMSVKANYSTTTPAWENDAMPVKTAPAKPEPKVQVHGDYHYDGVKVCILQGQEPDYTALPVGTGVYFWREVTNDYDPRAVVVSAEGVGKVGYLYRGKLQDMVNDFTDRSEAVRGEIDYNDGQTVRISMDFFRLPDDEEDDELGEGKI